MANKTKLELTWIGKENRPKLEPRILLEDPEKSYHAPHRVTDHDLFNNQLIFGDNLLALKGLEQDSQVRSSASLLTLRITRAVHLNTMMTALNTPFGFHSCVTVWNCWGGYLVMMDQYG
jgi:hypothetical protein